MFRVVFMAATAVALAGCASSESATEAAFRADDAKCKTTAATQAAMPTCNAGWPSICRKEMRKPKQRGSEPVLDHDGGF